MMKYRGWIYVFAWVLFVSAIPPKGDPAVLRSKLFYLPVQLDAHAGTRHALTNDAALRQLGRSYQERVRGARSECKTMACYAAALHLREDEVRQAGDRLVAAYGQNNEMKNVVNAVKAAGYYDRNIPLADTALLRFAWERTAEGMNYIFDTYLAGKRPRYAIIDSISFNVNDPAFKAATEKMLDGLLKKQKISGPYYALPLDAAIETLLLNGRDEAARYEPLTAGQNAAAYAAVARTEWEKYPYTALLVPGFGPDSPGVRIDHRGVARCKMAAERFNRKMAPFIIVSGGHVYPHRTPYSEAVEMKRYLTEELNIPASAVIIEPHARHTTTNMRNAGRLLYRFHMPVNKPSLVVTDSAQILMVANLDQRCMRELGIVPYRNVRILTGNEAEFYPVKHCFYINVQDISDP
ncbi:YdcF family protein [Chitinophaga sp. GCM10012297]|uniref:YdcF family protein n=1 Tax=Chitinophaga chungangae TaxID=2821488 RepID=A0ABS3YHQ4_9BACT|nr:YdcF family protein [Chitinophaga chungangae]MBO9153609.1 YdcF family protein [Chitinophaga chungangae]